MPKCTCSLTVCVCCAHLPFSTSISAPHNILLLLLLLLQSIDVHSDAKLRHQIVQVRQCILQSTRTFHSFAHLCVVVVVVAVVDVVVKSPMNWILWGTIAMCSVVHISFFVYYLATHKAMQFPRKSEKLNKLFLCSPLKMCAHFFFVYTN